VGKVGGHKWLQQIGKMLEKQESVRLKKEKDNKRNISIVI
jgi:hypothetical protein